MTRLSAGGGRVFWIAFAALLAYRALLCFEPPEDSSEVLRHLGFTAHLPERGLRFYEARPKDFQPEPWAFVWTNRHYNVPPMGLLFHAAFAVLHLGIAWVKLALTLADAGTALIFRRLVSPWAAVLFLANPVSVFYGSHEGQFEPLQTFLIALTVAAVAGGRWRGAGAAFAVCLQVKLFGVFLLPWIAYRLWREGGWAPFKGFGLGFVLGTLPSLPFYAVKPDLLWFSLFVRGAEAFNPFAWDFTDRTHLEWMPAWLFVWMSLVSAVLVGLAALHGAYRVFRGEPPWDLVPYVAFWTLLKTVALTAFYYQIPANAFLLCAAPRRWLVHLLLVVQLFACPRSVLFLMGRPFGHEESAATRALLARCLWTCDLREPARIAPR